ncbi:hypothetical protein [Specibacter sp. NPDC078709]|uniref:hypothetical protein n=1 Tax=Specibacter sp. NPDC078709 TaxID=3154364 RepID=UPI00342A2F2B
MCAGPADWDDEEGEQDVEEIVVAARDLAAGMVEPSHYVAAAVTVRAVAISS